MSSVRLLGPVEVWAGEERLVLGGPRQLALLGLLAVNANRAVSTDTFLQELWADQLSGRHALQMAVARLRQTLRRLEGDGEPVLRTVSGGYLLSLPRGALDVELFEALVLDGRRALEAREYARAGELLREALGLWRGPPLAELSYEEFAQPEIRRLEELRLSAIEASMDAGLGAGRHAELIGELEALVATHWTRERLAGQLMLALYRSSRQSEALEVYQRTRGELAGQLGLEPGPALKALQVQILEQAPALQATVDHTHGVPSAGAADGGANRVDRSDSRAPVLPLLANRTIGRGREIDAVHGLVVSSDARLITLTGPGGVGKTRLALAVAHAVKSFFSDGVCWVELAAVARPEDVAATILRALALTPRRGESPAEAVLSCLTNKRLLLVMDNFEHVLDAAVLVADLLAACPEIRILATSREPLRLGWEQQYSVPLLEAHAAVELFAARARAVAPGASIDRLVVGEICERLDRLPLAIELAAARTRMLSPPDILDRLRRRLPVTAEGPRNAPERQRTLRATIDWSYDLLSVEQRQLLARLAVFAGGCTLAAAQTVAKADLDALQALMDRSLIRREGNRYSMLVTIHDYALERLDHSGEGEDARLAHAQWLVELLEAQGLPHPGWPDARSRGVVASEEENFTAALEWASRTGRSEVLARLAGPLVGVWLTQGRLHEADRWMKLVLENQERYSGRLAAQVLSAAAVLARYRGEYDESVVLGQQALEHWREVGDKRAIGMTLLELAPSVSASAHAPRDRALWEQAIQFGRDNNLTEVLAGALVNLADLVLSNGSLSEGRALCEESLALSPPGSSAWDVAALNLAYIETVEGRPAEAEQLSSRALENALLRGDLLDTAFAAIALAWPLAQQGRLEFSARLLGAGLGFLQTAGLTPQWMDDASKAAVLDILHSQLDGETVEALIAEGRDRGLEVVASEALNDSGRRQEFAQTNDR